MSSLLEQKILILDGGLGTTLEDCYGIKFSAATPLWSSHLLISDLVTLRKAQTDFANAGADIILTATYQASHQGFRKTGIEDEVSRHFQSAVDISRNAFQGRQGLVALSLGAYGAVLQPSQEYSGDYGIGEEELTLFHAERLREFVACWDKIDLIAFETLPRLDEIRAIKGLTGSKPYWISCVFPNQNRLPDGSSIEEILVTIMAEPRPWGIGMNCTKVDKVSGLIKEFEEVAKKQGLHLPRLVLYPDGTNGLTYDTTRQEWVGEEIAGAEWDEKVVSVVKDTIERGNWSGIVVGGCCKTTPEHIAKLRMRLSS